MSASQTYRIGSLKFFFLGDTTPGTPITAPTTLNNSALYLTTFAEGKGEFNGGIKTTDVVNPVNGVNRRVAIPIIEAFPEYTIEATLFNENLTQLWYGGANPTSDTPPTSETVGTQYLFTGWGLVQEWDNGNVSAPAMVHAGFRCQLIPDGNITRDPSKPTSLKYKVVLIDPNNAGKRSLTGA